jgi:hypothetical protein
MTDIERALIEYDGDNTKPYCDLVYKALKELRDNRWIPVTERLPESGTHVLLSCKIRPNDSGYVCDGYYAAPKTIECDGSGDCACEYDEEEDKYFLLEGWYEVIKNWDDFSSICIDDFVTHWRTLPTSPADNAQGLV